MKITVKSILDTINEIINKNMNAFLNPKPQQIDKGLFFKNFGIAFGSISTKKLDALTKFIELTNKNFSEFTVNQWAYAYATTHHETNATFEPVKEAYWVKNADDWRRKNLRYYPYYGRGFVQLTWLENYILFSRFLGVDIVDKPDKVMDFGLSFKVMVHGMKNGTFTGKKLSDYISNLKADYVGARRVINGTDKAQLIAGYANKFESILKESLL